MTETVVSHSIEETVAFGKRFAQRLHGGEIIALRGVLGSGKTHLVKGICRGLGSSDLVSSPTFVFINEYEGRLKIFHVDLYRLESRGQLAPLGLTELSSPQSIVLVEWPDLAEGLLHFRYMIQCNSTGESTRSFTIEERDAIGA